MHEVHAPLISHGITASSCTLNAQMPKIDAPSVAETEVRNVSVCDLKNDPAKYNHASVKISGYFSRGFEDSTLYDPVCNSQQWIWVELAGKRSVGVMYCCGFTPKKERRSRVGGRRCKAPSDGRRRL